MSEVISIGDLLLEALGKEIPAGQITTGTNIGAAPGEYRVGACSSALAPIDSAA